MDSGLTTLMVQIVKLAPRLLAHAFEKNIKNFILTTQFQKNYMCTYMSI
jgi:hypothetical protein